MALRQLMLAKQIADKEKELEEMRGKDADFETREKELETSISEANTEAERGVVDGEIEKFEQERDAHNERKSELETKLSELREQMKEYEKTPERREKKKDMGRRNEEEIEEMRSAINSFVKSPVIAKSGSKMSTVAELEQNPELSKPKISNIDYSIATRRGYIPISQEAIDDADYDVTGLIRDEINDQSRNTRNTDIATVLKSATAKSVTGLDGLKDLVNKEIKKV